ncbi:orotate phosphoribosyltransferase [Alkalibacillus haloalkaliphilus]|uniref:orotate phosphoribosyltransferase n=1 Tax=Alkalibacillus haloalkaliphilus TaxID=94136 RepID=UPI0002E98488|nr:orotate phosphoribosyltransferase [Alkalibacillus haloalkaliphilus]
MVIISRQTIAQRLIDINALKVNVQEPFTWSSGIQSPVYCDNRLTMSYPDVRQTIANAFVNETKDLDVDVIAGCATAGIPHAAFVSDQLNLPMVYVRSKPKGHGLENMIEGKVDQCERVVVIEDLISTGTSAIKAAEALKEQGCHVVKVLSIFSYGLNEAEDNFKEAGFEYESLVTFEDVASLLTTNGNITEAEREQVLNWRDDLVLS